jgi:AraC-like DNA-binding protein
LAHLPIHWLRNWLEAPQDIAGKQLDPSSGWTRALSSVAAMLDPRCVNTLAVSPQLLAESLATLLSLAADPPAACATPHRRKLLRFALNRMRERFDDAELTARTVAAEMGISRRYLHVLFADEGTTFTGELMSYRLQLAERLLSDPQRRHTSITEIALRCGFTNAGHFTRRFRARTGRTPTEFRRR